MNKRNRLLAYLIITLLLLVWSNPDESDYLRRISKQYGSTHHGLSMNASTLLKIGEAYHSSYLLWGTYSYHFGNIGVSYIGIASFTFQIDSWVLKKETPQELIS